MGRGGEIPAAAPEPSAGDGLEADISRQSAEAQEKDKAQQKARVIARPFITAMSGEEAEMKIGQNRYVVTARRP